MRVAQKLEAILCSTTAKMLMPEKCAKILSSNKSCGTSKTGHRAKPRITKSYWIRLNRESARLVFKQCEFGSDLACSDSLSVSLGGGHLEHGNELLSGLIAIFRFHLGERLNHFTHLGSNVFALG